MLAGSRASVAAAAALRAIGHRPLLVDLEADNDTDHVIAVFKERGLWGSIAKSNYAFLEYRAFVQNVGAVTDPEGFAHVVIGDEDSDASFS